jgi:hypothetical protein
MLVASDASLTDFERLFEGAPTKKYTHYQDLPNWIQSNIEKHEFENTPFIHTFKYPSSFGFTVVIAEDGESNRIKKVWIF